MEHDERLTLLPVSSDSQTSHAGYSVGYSSYDDTLDSKRPVWQYLNIVYKRLPVILAVTVLITAVTALYSYRQPSIYQAQVRIIIEPRKPQLTVKDAVSISLSDDQKYYKTQVQLLQDPDLMKRVVVALGLYRETEFFAAQGDGIFGRLSLLLLPAKKKAEAETASPVANTVFLNPDNGVELRLKPDENLRAKAYAKSLTDGFRVKQVEGTNIIMLNVDNPNPALAVKVVHKLAETYMDENAELETAGTQKAYKDLGKSIDELKVTIAQQENDLIAYMRSSGLPLQEKGQDLAASRLEGMSAAWLKAMDNRRQLEARYNAAAAASGRGQGMNIQDLYDNKVFQDTMRLNTERRAKLQDQIREMDKQIQEAQTERDELLVTYTPEFRKVREKNERIVSLRAAKEKTEREVNKIIDADQKKIEKDAVGGALVALRSQLEAARVQETEAQAAYDLEASRANIQGQDQTKLTTLKREIETNRGLLDSYVQRQKEQELALGSERPNNIKIQNREVMPDEPIGPPRARNISAAFLLSLLAGIGLAFLVDYLDDSVRTSDDVSRHLGLPTLALIPLYTDADTRKVVPLPQNGHTRASPAALVTMDEVKSPMAEAYRHFRTSLLFSSAGKPPKTILVTSAQQSEGKTTTAINTAIILAQSDTDVVIIDCDLRRPCLHRHFDLENSHGLTNYLSGDKKVDNLIQSYGELSRLKVITSGPVPPNPAELLSSAEMRNLLKYLSREFKHVVIDSPPAISFTDAAILSTMVDGVVIVAMSNKSSIQLMRSVKHRFCNIGSRIYGVVLNAITAGPMEYNYYADNYYSYSSRPDKH